jgi:hypothetical protein
MRWLALLSLLAGCEVKMDEMGMVGPASGEEPAEPPPVTGCNAAPALGEHALTAGRAATASSFALNRCSGELAVAWTEGTGAVREAVEARGGTLAPAVRVSGGAGPVERPRLVWLGDLYAVVWQDGRPREAGCATSCRTEVYYAFVKADGTLARPERRLTNKVGPVRELRAAGAAGELAIAWSDTRDPSGAAVYVARIGADGTARGETRASEPGEKAQTPSLLHTDAGWAILYAVGAERGQAVLVRVLDGRGAVGSARQISAGLRPEAVRGRSGYTVLSQGGLSGAFLDFVQADWTVARSVAAPQSNNQDGSWSLAWDGSAFWVLASAIEAPVRAIRYDTNGMEIGRLTLAERADARDVEMELAGGVVVTKWSSATGALRLVVTNATEAR